MIPENPDALTTIGNLKAALGLSVSGDDDRLQRLIHATTAWIERQTNRKLKARNYGGALEFDPGDPFIPIANEDYLSFDGTTLDLGGETIYENGYGIYQLPQYPIVRPSVDGALDVELSILSTRNAGADGAGDTWTALTEGSDFFVDYAKGIIKLTGRFSPGIKNYRLKCTAGFYVGSAQPFVPDDLEELCIKLVESIYRNKANLQSESIGTWSRSFDTSKSDPFVEDTLDKFSRISL